MNQLLLADSAPDRRTGPRRALFVVVGAVLAMGFAAAALVTAFSWNPAQAFAPFTPSAASGHIEGSASIDDDTLPAIAKLDPSLRDAVRAAAHTAAAEGITVDITSGWRSEEHQRWLFDDAVRTYGSEEIARQYVAMPEVSRHVTGDAVDIGDLDAQLWLGQRGAEFGLCQIYANERWHFELATTPGGVCPAQRPDAAG